MKNINANRVRVLKLWEMLNRETDEDHRITTEEIRDRLAKEGIECERRVVYNDIKALCDNGYEVMTKRGVGNEYYVADREFSVPELLILMDAVQAASFITEKKTSQLIDKLAGLAGSRKAEVLKQNIVKFGTIKSGNENIYYSVNEITQAINCGRKIGFNYFHLDEKMRRVYKKDKEDETKNRWYVVSPEQTVFVNDKYYLFCHDDKHGDIVQYRVDRMSNVRMLEEYKTPPKEDEGFNLAIHKLQLFAMYGGEETDVSLIADKSILDMLIDKFGDRVTFDNDGDRVSFKAKVQVSPTFVSWCCAFGDKLKVTHPQWVKQEVKKQIALAARQYD